MAKVDNKPPLKDGPGERLGENNWSRWKRDMEAFLFLKGCHEWLKKPLPKDASEDQKKSAYSAVMWIRLCVNDNWSRRIKNIDEPHELWQLFRRGTLRI
jgi:hypothetical protein